MFLTQLPDNLMVIFQTALTGNFAMRLPKLAGATLLSLLISCFTAISYAQTDQNEILALYKGWINAVEGSDIDAYVGGLHPDVSLRPPGVQGLDGRENYRVFLGPVFDSARYEITVDVPHSITMMGDAAVVEYDYTIKRIVDAASAAALPEGALQGDSTTSHYIDVVAKDDTGAWKIRLHSWSMTL